jgi:hypothetical protein
MLHQALKCCPLLFKSVNASIGGMISIIFMISLPLSSAVGQQCPSAPSVSKCRSTADSTPQGALLHKSNKNGRKIWISQCGPNTFPSYPDTICQQISSCQGAGGFGKFLQAVTSNCTEKHFEGFFGLDGLTFGILDWTEDNLPPILRAFQSRSESKFDETLGKLNLPMERGCLNPQWACESNRHDRFMCNKDFYDAFSTALKTSEFQKAQIDFALKQYNYRLKTYEKLGLKTEYGNTTLAVVANNLVRKDSCRPETWRKHCESHEDEHKLVDCMLEQYVKNECRGSLEGSKRRARSIKNVFLGSMPSNNIHPTAEAVISCSDSWGATTKLKASESDQ